MAGSQSTKTEVPKWIERPSRSVIDRGEAIGKIGYTPYYGPDVAAFTPQQNAAFENTNAAANAFGLSTGANAMPAPQQFSNGMVGYSSAPLFEEAKYRLYQNAPNQYGYLNSFFVNPVTGEYAPTDGGQPNPGPVPNEGGGRGKGGGRSGGGGERHERASYPAAEWGAAQAAEQRAANRAAGNIAPDFSNFTSDARDFGTQIYNDAKDVGTRVTGLLGF